MLDHKQTIAVPVGPAIQLLSLLFERGLCHLLRIPSYHGEDSQESVEFEQSHADLRLRTCVAHIYLRLRSLAPACIGLPVSED